MVWSENSIHPDLNLNENQEITNYPIFPKWYSLAYMSGKMRKHKKDQKGPEARLLQERCVHCHQLFSQVNNSIEREIFEIQRLHLVWQSSRIVPVCSRCAEARYRVHVLSCLCQVSSLPLSLRGWKLYRWEPPGPVASNWPGPFQMMTFVPVITLTATWASAGWASPCWRSWCRVSVSTLSSPPATPVGGPARCAGGDTSPSHLYNITDTFYIFFAIHAIMSTVAHPVITFSYKGLTLSGQLTLVDH